MYVGSLGDLCRNVKASLYVCINVNKSVLLVFVPTSWLLKLKSHVNLSAQTLLDSTRLAILRNYLYWQLTDVNIEVRLG